MFNRCVIKYRYHRFCEGDVAVITLPKKFFRPTMQGNGLNQHIEFLIPDSLLYERRFWLVKTRAGV